MPERDKNESSLEGEGEFSSTWRRYVQALRRLLSGVPTERSLIPFLPLRDSALDACERFDTVANLEKAWLSLHSSNNAPDVAHLLLMELNAFPAAVDVAEDDAVSEKPVPLPKKRLLSAGKTLLESARDLFDDLPLTVKGVLKVLTEVIDLFRGE